MAARGRLVSATPGSIVLPKPINIGSGTNVQRPSAPCYQLDYDILSGSVGGNNINQDTSALERGKVVQFQQAVATVLDVTRDVTDLGSPEGEASVSC